MLQVEVGANIAKLSGGLQQAQNQLQGFVAKNSAVLDSFANKATEIGSKMSLAFSLPLGLLGKQAVKNAGDLESLEMGLKAIEEQQFGVGKSAEYAKLRLAEYIEVAKLPGLGLRESIQASINLRSVGFTAGEAKRDILAFANALALVGKGKNELSGVNLQLTQLAGKTSGFGADLRIIREYAPQVGGALLKAFGTIDTEKIAKMGFNGKQVIDRLVLELEKLPKAGQGINNTFENLSDAIFNSLGRIGLALNKAFNIQGNIDKFADFVTGLANSFASLNPIIQKVIGVVGILAVALPPILVTVGLMLPAITALGGVLAGVTAPILGIGVAIGGLVYIISKNWDAIVQKLSDWGFLGQIKSTFNSWIGFLNAGFQLIKDVIGGTWSYFKDTLIPFWEGFFSTLTIVVRSAFGVIEGLFKIFKGVITFSWKGIWEGLKIILLNVFDGVISTLAKLVGLGATLIGKFFKMISGDDTLLKWATKLDESGMLLNKVNKEIDNTNSKKKVAPDGTTTNTKPTIELTEEQLNAIKKYNEKSLELYEKANILRQENYANSLKNELQKSIALEESKYNAKRNEVNKEVADQRAKNALLAQLEIEHQNELKRIRDSYKATDSIKSKAFEVGGIGSVMQTGESGFGKVGAVNNRQSVISAMIERLQNDIPRLKEIYAKIGLTVSTETDKLRNRTIAGFKQFNPSMTENVLNILMTLNQRIGETLLQGATNAFSGIGNIAGQMIAGSASIADAGNMILGVIGTVFSQMGEQFISAGVAMSGLYALLSNPFTSAPALIAVGVALSALGGAISATISNAGNRGGYTPNYSSGNGSSPSMSSVSQQQMRLTINLSGELTAKGNNLVALINKTQKEVVRTRS